ncbi:hypothetical protein BYT27DRAFT_6819784 [Phlegmacium glaucopus]|nr:hypothetical protein BYT27DRAFT_6819784 [Phlegmacium glaucopus]
MKFTILFFLASATLAVATPEMQTKRSIQARDPRIDLERMVIRSDDGTEFICRPCCTPVCVMNKIPCTDCSCCA